MHFVFQPCFHLLQAAELLKHPHLQNYVTQCQMQSYFRLRSPLRQIHLNDKANGDIIYDNHVCEPTELYDSEDPLMDSNQHIDINGIEPCDWPLFYDENDTSATMSENSSSMATGTGIVEWVGEICTPGDNLREKVKGQDKVTPKVSSSFSKCSSRGGESPLMVLNGPARNRSPQLKPSTPNRVCEGRQSVTQLLHKRASFFFFTPHCSPKTLFTRDSHGCVQVAVSHCMYLHIVLDSWFNNRHYECISRTCM